MKPKTKLQKAVAQVQGTLKPVTNAQKKYGENRCFEKIGVFGKSSAVCYECGQSWKTVGLVNEKKISCPCCGERIKMIETRGRKKLDTNYYAIVTTVGVFQLCRMIIIKKFCKAGSPAEYLHKEVMQQFLDSQGNLILYSIPINGFGSYDLDSWCMHGDMELRKCGEHSRADRLVGLVPEVVCPNHRVLPIFYRNGFKDKFYDIAPTKLFSMLLSDPKAETLIKANQTALLQYHYYKRHLTNQYWNAIKFCLRNDFHVEDASSWFDYLTLLKYFKKDVGNPKFVCPPDFHKAHNLLVEKKRVIDNKIAEQRRIEEDRRAAANAEIARQRAIVDEENFKKFKEKFFNLNFSDGQLVVCVLQSIEEFKKEGDLLKHCVHTNGYFREKDSLILSARMNGNPVETIEFDLKKGQVVQCRGWDNKPTPHHSRIIKLVNKNAGSIMRLVG